MIIEIKGDIIKALEEKDIDILAHGCNCRNGFGSGIAGQLAKRIPESKIAYHQLYKMGKAKLGNVQYVNTPKGIVANCMTQDKYGNARKNGEVHLDYEALDIVLKKLKKKALEGKRVGIPQIGCGLAGGDWDKVKKMIEDIFQDTQIFVYYFGGKK